MKSQPPHNYVLNKLDKTQFLEVYWQKKPVVLRQAFTDFVDPLDEHELAGLAEDPDIDARVVSCKEGSWNVVHGPIDDFEEACIGSWSLLVQSVDHHIPCANALMAAFDFIPHWRMDDLMVSFSNQGAGVGAHIDQYDVFIIQGKGSRRWQVGSQGDYSEHFPHSDLRQIAPFEALIDEVLVPGDVIYIPPGFPHNGVALEDCLNYSVGFRAPSQQEMLSSLADFAIDEGLFNQRYSDQQLSERGFSGEIKQQELAAFKNLFQQVLDSADFPRWLGHYLSKSQEDNAFEQYGADTLACQDIIDSLNNGVCFVRQLGIKPVFIENSGSAEQDFTFYLEGQSFVVPGSAQDLLKRFLNAPQWAAAVDTSEQNNKDFIQIMTTLVNAGYWYPSSDLQD
jgi:50S ribosomal protein L16 3-hydroxylase